MRARYTYLHLPMNLSSQIIQYLIKNTPSSEKDILAAKRKFCKPSQSPAPTNAELLLAYKKLKADSPKLAKLLTKRQVRTLSGIAPIAVLTKPYPCPGNCAYCPNQPNLPKSYLSNEPAVMRAILCKFNPYAQVQLRLKALTNNGHPTDKLELIVMGGTWSHLPHNYQTWYIKECFRAANDFPNNKKVKKISSIKILDKQLKSEQYTNETAQNRIIGLTLETRPDFITPDELQRMRSYGCTRIEIGVQHTSDNILTLNKRGHLIDKTIQATSLMRRFGFKITYHLMLNLPGSTLSKDYKMMQDIFSNPLFQPDQIKLYPTVVSKGTLIHRWAKQGAWQAYSTQQLINLLIKIKSITPAWVRIIRVIRDIPEESILAGNKITNLRQAIQAQMTKKNLFCQCIRCREAGHQLKNTKIKSIKNKLFIRKYKVADGTEIFISFESPNQRILFAFCRLYLPTDQTIALIRELHTYGPMIPIGQPGHIQHQGLGKKLLSQAQKIAAKKKYSQLNIISGIGVRDYYRKLGYQLKNTYMLKNI